MNKILNIQDNFQGQQQQYINILPIHALLL